jgi:integrase
MTTGTSWIRFYHPILERPGITRTGLHAFHHGNATIMDGLNAPLRVRQDRLGHEKVRRLYSCSRWR